MPARGADVRDFELMVRRRCVLRALSRHPRVEGETVADVQNFRASEPLKLPRVVVPEVEKSNDE